MWKKLIIITLILGLIPTYIIATYAAPSPSEDSCNNTERIQGEQVGVCTEVSMNVIRGYYFDTVKLPVTRFGMNIDLLNQTFLPALLILAGLVWRR